jgi:transcriptional regulator with XRE-family HTH domain
MPTAEEKAAFTERLQFAMRRAPEMPQGPTELALHFNLRYRGAQPISPQTAHKWLSGRTIPTADKLQTLAEWLDVDLHWLHYGPPPGDAKRAVPKPRARGEKYGCGANYGSERKTAYSPLHHRAETSNKVNV